MNSEIEGTLQNSDVEGYIYQLNSLICVWQLVFSDMLLSKANILVNKEIVIKGEQIGILENGGLFRVDNISPAM